MGSFGDFSLTQIVENFNSARIKPRLPLIVLLALCGLIATGCSVIGLGYSALPAYGLWQVGRFVSLDDAQQEFVRQALGEFHQWHRNNELPQYRKMLVEVQKRTQRPVQEADLSWVRDQIDTRWRVTSEKVAPALAELALTLNADQIRQIQRRLDRQNREHREKFLPEDVQERQKRRVSRTIERFESFVGDLNPAQKKIIQTALEQTSARDETWFEERLQRQTNFRDLAEKIRVQKPSRETATAWMKDYLINAPKPSTPQRKAIVDRSLQIGDQMTVDLLATLTTDQRKKLANKLSGWTKDIESLIREPLSN